MTEPAHSTTFEKAIHVTPIDTNTYSAHLDPSWCIGQGRSLAARDTLVIPPLELYRSKKPN
jgi:hypothetical protein